MKKLITCISMGLVCMGLCACEGTGFDPALMQETTKSIEEAAATVSEASKTIDEVSKSFEEISKAVSQITGAMQEGVDSTNNFVDWYQNDAIPENPWINPPLTEEEVENAIKAGQDGLNAYIEQFVDKNASYNVMSNADADFFTDCFEKEEFNGYLLSTYDNPRDCNIDEVFSRYTDVINDLSAAEDDVKAEGKVLRKDVDASLDKVLGIDSDDLSGTVEYTEISGKEYLLIDEVKPCEKLVCSGGLFYNDLYLVIMREKYDSIPFSITILSRNDDDSVNIFANYWSRDMKNADFSGAFMFDLYDKILNSDLKAVLNIPGLAGNISLGASFDEVGGLDFEDIGDALELVSDKKDKVKTYMQKFKGYEVYYSNVDPKAAGEYFVSQIDVTSGDFKTAEGIGIGTGIDKLKETYGEGIEAMMSGGRKQVMYEMGKYNMLFMIDKSGKVAEMSIFLADVDFAD